MNHEHHHCHESHELKLGLKIAKLVLVAGLVCVGSHVAKELHKIHKAIEHKSK